MREAQPVVADVVRRVDRLRHRPERGDLHHGSFGRALEVLEDRVEVFAVYAPVLACRELVAEGLDVVAQRLDLLGVRAVVDAVDERLGVLALTDVLGDGPIREQHQLLDQPVRLLALLADDLDRHAFVVEDDLDLGRVEVDRALPLALLGERPGELGREQHVVLERVVLRPAVDNGLRVVVGEALLGVDDGLPNLVVLDRAARRDLHDARVGELVLVRPERADAVRELFGEHRDDAVHEVRARPALVGLGVEEGALLDVVAHVRDVDPELDVAAREPLDVDGVVEVLGVVGVDREDCLVAEVEPALNLGRGDGDGDVVGLLFDLFRELRLDALAQGDGEDGHARVRRLAQDL